MGRQQQRHQILQVEHFHLQGPSSLLPQLSHQVSSLVQSHLPRRPPRRLHIRHARRSRRQG
ncbi:hypothetical protein LINPERPRIM_LOCUS18975 [Linum perenne]